MKMVFSFQNSQTSILKTHYLLQLFYENTFIRHQLHPTVIRLNGINSLSLHRLNYLFVCFWFVPIQICIPITRQHKLTSFFLSGMCRVNNQPNKTKKVLRLVSSNAVLIFPAIQTNNWRKEKTEQIKTEYNLNHTDDLLILKMLCIFYFILSDYYLIISYCIGKSGRSNAAFYLITSSFIHHRKNSN